MPGPLQTVVGCVIAAGLLLGTARAQSLSESLMYAGDVDAALKAAASEARAAPDDVVVHERWIDLQLTLGLGDQAVAQARGRVAAHPQSADAHYLLGRAVPSAAEARAAYERALRIEPTHARAHMGMGAVYTAEADLDGALAAYGRATGFDAGLAEAWLGLARAHIVKEEPEAALAVARRAMKAVPASPDAYLIAALLDPGSARATLEVAAAKAGQDARVHAAYAEVLLNAGQAPKALQAADRALGIDPTDEMALRVKLFASALGAGTLDAAGWQALVQAQGGSPAAFEPLVTRYPRSALTWAGRAQARLSAGDAAGALTDLAKAAQLDPDEPEILGAYGLLLLQQGRASEAVGPLAKASQARPWDPSLGTAHGAALSKLGRHDQAIAVLSALSTRRRYDSQIAIAHADALLLAGQAEAAYQVVLQAAERRMDPRLMIALVAAATQVGRFGEAADMLEQIGRSTGDPKALELASRLRARAATP